MAQRHYERTKVQMEHGLMMQHYTASINQTRKETTEYRRAITQVRARGNDTSALERLVQILNNKIAYEQNRLQYHTEIFDGRRRPEGKASLRFPGTLSAGEIE